MADDADTRRMIVNFAKDNPRVLQLQFIRDDPEVVCIELVTDSGIINHVFRVQSADRISSVILKYTQETLRMVPTEKLPLERQELEYNCLCLMQEVEPGSAPQPFCLDKNYNIMAMADLSDWELLAYQLGRGHVDLKAAAHLGEVLGKLCKQTSKSNVTQEQWKTYHETIHHDGIKEIARELTYDRTFNETDSINYIPKSIVECYRACIKEIRSRGLDKKLNDLFNLEVSLVHGDCHYKSIFVKDGHVSLIDFEFSFLGNPAHTIAYPIECYILSYVLHETHGIDSQIPTGRSDVSFRPLCLQAIRNMVSSYLEVVKDIANDEAQLASFLSEVTLFTGGFAFQVSVFKAVENFIRVYDDEDRRRMLEIGFDLMKNHEDVKNLDQFMEAISFTFGSC